MGESALEDAMEQRLDDLLAIGREIAALDGAGDTGMGAGQYEVFITRGGVEYRVTIEPYWDDGADEPFASSDLPPDSTPLNPELVRRHTEAQRLGE